MTSKRIWWLPPPRNYTAFWAIVGRSMPQIDRRNASAVFDAVIERVREMLISKGW